MKHDAKKFMQMALDLAARGQGRVSPNPCVGCVIVKNGKVIAKGFHQVYGGPHAEVNALRHAGTRAKGATMYVTLEPCSHWGKTPPCAPAVAAAGLRNVVIAMKDPNPLVAGKGIQVLRSRGIRVELGLLSTEAENLNRAFVTFMKKRRPYVVLKMAMTLDGKIASRTGNARWVSSPESRALVHELRAQSDAVLVGANTASLDNPELTSHGAGRNPLRIILDPNHSTSPRLKVFKTSAAKTLLVTKRTSTVTRHLERRGVKVLAINKSKENLLRDLLRNLAKLSVSQLLVEGGGETAWGFLKSGLVDEVLFIVAPKLIGGRTAKTPVEGDGFATMAEAWELKRTTVERLGTDFLIRGFLH